MLFFTIMKLKIIIFLGTIFITLSFIKVNGQNFDINVLESINPVMPDAFVMKSLTNTAYPISAGMTAGIFINGLIRKNKEEQYKAVELGSSIFIAALSAQSLKWIFDRPRPYQTYSTISPYKVEDGASMPSGHTTIAFATATSLSLQYKKWYVVVPAYTWAATVGYSRLYLGAHYPSDALAGAVVGTASAFAGRWISKKIFR